MQTVCKVGERRFQADASGPKWGLLNQAGSGCGDSFVGRCQGNAYVATRGRTVKVSRRDQDSQTSQEIH